MGGVLHWYRVGLGGLRCGPAQYHAPSLYQT